VREHVVPAQSGRQSRGGGDNFHEQLRKCLCGWSGIYYTELMEKQQW